MLCLPGLSWLLGFADDDTVRSMRLPSTTKAQGAPDVVDETAGNESIWNLRTTTNFSRLTAQRPPTTSKVPTGSWREISSGRE